MSHKKHRTETNCLNCGAEVTGKFCPNCGQENVEVHETFSHLMGHFVSDYLHFDSKFFRSLAPLIAKPGFLTDEYWKGRRIHYILPIRLFFFITVLFMLCTSFFYSKYGKEMKRLMITNDNREGGYDSTFLFSQHDTTRLIVKDQGEIPAKELKENYIRHQRQFRKLNSGLDFTFKNLKYVTFFLLPVYALIFKLLYRRRRPYYIDHVIYVMHLQSFSYIVMTVLFVLPVLGVGLLMVRQILLLVLLVYIGISVHRLYQQEWWKTLIKSILAGFMLFFVTALTLFAVAGFDAIFIQ